MHCDLIMLCINVCVSGKSKSLSVKYTLMYLPVLLASPGIYVGRLDSVEEELSHSDTLHIDEVGLEQSLGGLKPLPSYLDHTTIWQLEMCGREEMKREGKKV